MPVPYKNIGPVDASVELDLSKLDGKSVIVTGGSSGLGAAYVQAFLKAGAYVTNADIQSPIDNSSPSDKKNLFVRTDVTKFADQVSMFKAALKHSPTGRIDIVVANAGIASQDPIFTLDSSSDPVEPDLKILNITLIGMMYTAKCAMHYWQFDSRPAEEKCFIVKSSLAGYIDLPAATTYQVSKYGARGLMVNLRVSDRCRSNLIAPWFIRTPIISEQASQVIGARLDAMGLGWAEVEDSVKAVLRVATDEAINGRALAVCPRADFKEGWVDMERDDYPEGSALKRWLQCSSGASHRAAV